MKVNYKRADAPIRRYCGPNDQPKLLVVIYLFLTRMSVFKMEKKVVNISSSVILAEQRTAMQLSTHNPRWDRSVLLEAMFSNGGKRHWKTHFPD